MAEDRPSVAKPVSRPRSRKPPVLSAVGISAAPQLQQDLCRQARPTSMSRL